MPKYESSCPNTFFNNNLKLTERYSLFKKEKAHILEGIRDPNHRTFIFSLYVKKYESIKQAFEENSQIDSFNDEDIDNIFIEELNRFISSGEFNRLIAGYVKHKIENQCLKEGREPPKFTT